jgi:NADPH-dependent ferric siderophore reductase
MFLPDGEGYVWAAGEATLMRAVRQLLCVERGIDKRRIRASAYWKRGAQAVHETIDE